MRAVLDTNILVAALLKSDGPPGLIVETWRRHSFDLVTCERQLQELRETFLKPHLRSRVARHRVGRLLNELSRRALHVQTLPHLRISPDPEDDYLLALADVGAADYLVSGDKSGLLALRRHANARILTARDFLTQLT